MALFFLQSPEILGAAETNSNILSMQNCVSLALREAPNVARAKNIVLQAEQSLVMAKSEYYPNLSVNAGYDRRFREQYSFDFSTLSNRFIKVETDSYSAGLSANQLLFGGGRRVFEHRAAKYRLRAADQRLMEAEIQVRLTTEKAFLSVHQARDEEVQAIQRLEVSQADGRLARLRVQSGAEPLNVRLTAEANVGQAEYNLALAQSQVQGSEDTLLDLMGKDPGKHLQLEAPPASGNISKSLEWCEERVQHRYELQAMKQDLRASKSSFLSTLTTWIPSIRLSGNYSLWTDKLPFSKPTWSFGISAGYPLLDGGIRAARTRSSQLELTGAQKSGQARLRSARLEIRASYRAAILAEKNLMSSMTHDKASHSRYRLRRLQYLSGQAGGQYDTTTGSFTELLRAQSSWTQSSQNALRARYDVMRRQAELAAYLAQPASALLNKTDTK